MNQESNRGVNPANRTGNSTRRAESGREEGFDSGLKSLMDWARGDGSQETGRYRIQERLRAACPSKIYREAVAGAFLAGNAAQLRGPVQTAAWETVKALGRHPDDPLSWALAAELAGLAVSAEEPGSASLPVEVREWEVALVKEVLSTSELRAESAAVRDALSTRDGQQGVQALQVLGVDAETMVRTLVGNLAEVEFAGDPTVADAARALLQSALRLTYVFAGRTAPGELSHTSPGAIQAGSSLLAADEFVDANYEAPIPSASRVWALMEAARGNSVPDEFAGALGNGEEPPFRVLARAVLTDETMSRALQKWLDRTFVPGTTKLPLNPSPAVISYFEQLALLPPGSQDALRNKLIFVDFAGPVAEMKRTVSRLAHRPCSDIHLMALYLAKGLLETDQFLAALGLRRSDLGPTH